MTLLRYIHLNPVKACIVTEPAEYQWTSHRVYLGTETLPWVTSEFGLGFFGSCLGQARISYRSFMAQPSYASEDRLLDDVHPDDPRIIGTDRFLASLPLSPYRPKSSLTLEQVANEVCREHGITIADLLSPRRHQSLVRARRAFVHRAINERIANVRQTAEFLNRDPSTISRLL